MFGGWVFVFGGFGVGVRLHVLAGFRVCVWICSLLLVCLGGGC